jgi:hypothetical protein
VDGRYLLAGDGRGCVALWDTGAQAPSEGSLARRGAPGSRPDTAGEGSSSSDDDEGGGAASLGRLGRRARGVANSSRTGGSGGVGQPPAAVYKPGRAGRAAGAGVGAAAATSLAPASAPLPPAAGHGVKAVTTAAWYPLDAGMFLTGEDSARDAGQESLALRGCDDC